MFGRVLAIAELDPNSWRWGLEGPGVLLTEGSENGTTVVLEGAPLSVVGEGWGVVEVLLPPVDGTTSSRSATKLEYI
jgi:hypothetical protein